ncbi:MAG: hypothetical protein GEU75_02990 [Dehalococcoidia bacterium]|nr:hypothetical protein [Dehalococcoidia bacterium]
MIAGAAILLAVAGCSSDNKAAIEATSVAATATSEATTKLLEKGALSFRVPKEWQLRLVDGHDFSLLILANAAREIQALGMLIVSPVVMAGPDYMDERRETVPVGGVEGVVLKGLVPGRTGLNDYLGFWADIQTPARPDFDIHVADQAKEEWRVIVQAPGKARFELAMAVETAADRAVFEEIVRTLTPPD